MTWLAVEPCPPGPWAAERKDRVEEDADSCRWLPPSPFRGRERGLRAAGDVGVDRDGLAEDADSDDWSGDRRARLRGMCPEKFKIIKIIIL